MFRCVGTLGEPAEENAVGFAVVLVDNGTYKGEVVGSIFSLELGETLGGGNDGENNVK